MKKLYLFIIINFSITNLFACNICGCGLGGYHYGILPQFQKNFVGLRYDYRSYTSHMDESHTFDTSNEFFQNIELWGRFYPSKRIQVFAFVPYKINYRDEGSETLRLKGLGDIRISANFNLINTYDSSNTIVKNTLLLGAGIKLPTGRFTEIRDGLTVNQNFQLGTGSVDYVINLIHTIRYKKLGLNTEAAYSFNTTNKDEYKFGNTITGNMSVFYIYNKNFLTLMPHTGMSYECNKDNSQFGIPYEDTGGWATLYQAGVDTFFKNVSLGITYSHPGKQDLFNGSVHAHDRYSVRISIMI